MNLTNEDFKQLKCGDEILFRKFYYHYREKIYTYLNIMTGYDEAIAMELLNDSFYSAYKALPQLYNKEKIQSFLFTIAKRKVIDYIRKKYSKKSIDINYFILDKKTYDPDILLNIMEDEKKLLINTAFSKLKPLQKEVLNKKYVEEKSLKNIAEKMNKSVKAVESLLFKSRTALKEEINKLLKKTGLEKINE